MIEATRKALKSPNHTTTTPNGFEYNAIHFLDDLSRIAVNDNNKMLVSAFHIDHIFNLNQLHLPREHWKDTSWYQ